MALKPRRLVLRQSSDFIFWWDLFIIVVAMFSCAIYSYLFAFTDHYGLDVFSLIINILFLIDIMICFRTTYINNATGDEIYSPKMIARQYGFSRIFIFDLISVIPFNFFLVGVKTTFGGLTRLLILLKVVRLGKLDSIISNFNISDQAKGQLKVLKLILFLVLFIHVYACVIKWMFDINHVWFA